jgi:hypothetical protein
MIIVLYNQDIALGKASPPTEYYYGYYVVLWDKHNYRYGVLSLLTSDLIMVSSMRPIAFILRHPQAGQLQSHAVSFRKSAPSGQAGVPRIRAASNPSQSLATPTKRLRASATDEKPSTQETHSIWTAIKIAFFGQKPPPTPYIPAPFNVINNPYRAHKHWPPDFTTLHPKHQLHYEKAFRRRMELKWARPTWKKATLVFQFALTVLIVGYWTFFLDIDDKGGTAYNAVSLLPSSHFVT